MRRWRIDLLGKRLTIDIDWSSLNLPRLSWDNQGPDFRFIAFTWGNGYSDPVLLVELDLSERTRHG